MSIVDRLFKGFFGKSVANPAIFGFLTAQNMPKMTEREFLKAYKSWVYACTNAISERVADIELKLQQVQKDGTWKDIVEHPSLDLLHHVNDFMSLYELIFSYAAFQELDGNSFWYLVKGANGKLVEIWPLDPTKVTIAKSEKNFIAGYIYQNDNGKKVPFEPNEILHFKRFSPDNPYRGKGTVEAAAIAIDTDTNATEWQRNFFGNSAIPSAILTTTQELSQDQYDRIKLNWDAKFRGTANSNKLGVLEGGMSYQPVMQTLREMQFTESRKDLRDEILAIFRVPKTILGISEDVNFASAQATEYVFAKYVIKPKMTFFVTKLNEFYLPLFGLNPYQYRFTYADPVPENIEQQVLVRNSGIQNYYLTINEARAQLGLEPVEGGDEIYIPTLLQPIANSQTDEGGNPTPAPKGLRKLSDFKKAVKANVKPVEAPSVNPLYTTYQGLNEQLKSLLLENLLKAKSAKKPKKKDAPTDQLVNILFDGEQFKGWVGLLYNASKEGMQKIMSQTGSKTMGMLEVDSTFDMQNPHVLDWLSQHAMEDSQSYSDSMKEAISLKVQEGIEAGSTNEEIASSMGEFFDDQSDWRAMRIARTETINAHNGATLEAYIQSGEVNGKEWLTDDNPCPICQQNAGDGVIPLGAVFSSGDDAPTAHPNCECGLGADTSD